MIVTSWNYEAGGIRLHITYGDIYMHTNIHTGAYIEGGPRGHGPPHDQKGGGQSVIWPPPWDEMIKKINNTLKTLLPSRKQL